MVFLIVLGVVILAAVSYLDVAAFGSASGSATAAARVAPAAQYDDIARSSGLQEAANQVDTDLGNLAAALAS
jgi:energy-converting hydrogenase Eha subunit C